jgi:hypothetical protein
LHSVLTCQCSLHFDVDLSLRPRLHAASFALGTHLSVLLYATMLNHHLCLQYYAASLAFTCWCPSHIDIDPSLASSALRCLLSTWNSPTSVLHVLMFFHQRARHLALTCSHIDVNPSFVSLAPSSSLNLDHRTLLYSPVTSLSGLPLGWAYTRGLWRFRCPGAYRSPCAPHSCSLLLLVYINSHGCTFPLY